MDGLLVTLAALGVWIAIFSLFRRLLTGNRTGKRRRTVSSDGHVVPANQDLTCETTQGHVHRSPSGKEESEFDKRYIVLYDPETGYVVLNGVMRRISDCKDL